MAVRASSGPASVEETDNPVLESLTGPHRRWAEHVGGAVRYPPDVAPFFAVPDDATAADWDDAATLLGRDPGFIIGPTLDGMPADWNEVEHVEAFLMAAEHPIGAQDERVRRLVDADAPAALALVRETRPGPFGPRTIRLGGHVAVEEEGELLAIGGVRLRGQAWVEISTVCTTSRARGRGLASAIVRHLAAAVEAEGRTPVLHVEVDNPAQQLYRRLGFGEVRLRQGAVVRPPA